VVSDSFTQRRTGELQEQIRRLRHAIQKEYALPQTQRRGQALSLYSSELDKAERNYQALLDDSRSASGERRENYQSATSAEDIQRLLASDTALM